MYSLTLEHAFFLRVFDSIKLELMTRLMPQVCSVFLNNNFYCYSGIIAWIFNEANETVFIRLISLKYFVNSRKRIKSYYIKEIHCVSET